MEFDDVIYVIFTFSVSHDWYISSICICSTSKGTIGYVADQNLKEGRRLHSNQQKKTNKKSQTSVGENVKLVSGADK